MLSSTTKRRSRRRTFKEKVNSFFTKLITSITNIVRVILKVSTMLLMIPLLITLIDSTLTGNVIAVIFNSVAMLLTIKINSEVG